MEVLPYNLHRIQPASEPDPDLKISVVIPVYNRSQIVRRTVESLMGQKGVAQYEVIVADDGSEEDIESALSGLEVRHVRQERRAFGAGRARNLGCSVASGDVVVFVDSDCLVDPEFLARHARWHERGERRVVIGGRSGAVMGSDDDLVDYRKRLNRRTSNLRVGNEVFRSLVTANISLPLWLFRDVGGFDERVHRWGGEDTELGWRLWNGGATFINDPDNSVTHQLEEDPSGGEQGREGSRDLNRGLMSSLIPHRFYRPGPPQAIPAVPKISVLVHDIPNGAAKQIWEELQDQPRSDFEVIFVSNVDTQEPLAGASVGDPRLAFVEDLSLAVDLATGEYVCFLNGHTAQGRPLLQEVIKRLDKRPSLLTATVGYRVDGPEGGSVRSVAGAAEIDAAWGTAMPLCWFTRKRELAKLRLVDVPAEQLWDWCRRHDLNLHWHSAAVRVPGTVRRDRPDSFTNMPPSRRQVAEELLANPRGAVSFARTYLETRRTGSSAGSTAPASAAASVVIDPPVAARYIGWTGQHNLGDEVMLSTTRRLLPWAEIETSGEAGKLLLLGGGTLINRSSYLRRLTHIDVPRLERAVLGTGVANPEYWGLNEDPQKWIDWLDTCSYVGVRGPLSQGILREWGFGGELEVCGDTALLVERPAGKERQFDRVVIAPAWTKGELWGGSDDAVVEALSSAASRWLTQGKQVVLMSSSPDDDGQILEIINRVNRGILPFVQGYRDNQEAIDLIASAGVVIGERLHACIIAAAVETPFVALEYRPKLRDFAASVGMDHLVLRTDDVDDRKLYSKLDEALDTDIQPMMQKVDAYRARIRSAAARIEKATTG